MRIGTRTRSHCGKLITLCTLCFQTALVPSNGGEEVEVIVAGSACAKLVEVRLIRVEHKQARVFTV
jgi:hypothetical protein